MPELALMAFAQWAGIKSPVGIKIAGPDLQVIGRIGAEVESVVKAVPGATSAFFERVSGGRNIQLTRGEKSSGNPRWSPDGEWLAFASDRDNTANIYLMDADGKNVRAVTGEKTPAGRCYCASFSPDGKSICYGRIENGKATVHMIHADGTGDRTIVVGGWDPAWSPDGSRIAFAKQTAKAQRLCLCDPDGGHVTELRDVDNPLGFTMPAWSPDGTRIAYSDTANGALELFLINADGTGRRQLTWAQHANVYPAWSPDGKTLMFVHVDQGGTGYMRINADGTQLDVSPLTLIDRPDRFDFRPAFRPRPGPVMPRFAKLLL